MSTNDKEATAEGEVISGIANKELGTADFYPTVLIRWFWFIMMLILFVALVVRDFVMLLMVTHLLCLTTQSTLFIALTTSRAWVTNDEMERFWIN